MYRDRRIEAETPLLDNLHCEIEEETGLRMTELPRLIAAQDILHHPERHVVSIYLKALFEDSSLKE